MPLDVNSAPPGTTPRETRLADYRPPAFLVETVELSFDLDEAATRVRSRMTVRRNRGVDGPRRAAVARRRGADAGARGAERRGTRRQSLPRRGRQAAHPRHAGRRHAGDRDAHRAEGQHRTLRPLHLERQLLHPMRGGRLPPHHVFSRSPRRDGALHHHDHRRQGAVPIMLSNGNPGAIEDAGNGRHRVTWTDPHPKPMLSVRARRRRSGGGEGPASPRAPVATWSLASGCAAATRTAARMRCAR